MTGGEIVSEIAGPPSKPWPKVHLVYFLLAAFDLVAILGGLFLSHQVIRVFERNVQDYAALDRLMASSWILVDTAADAQAAAADALTTRNSNLARVTFTSKVYELRQEAGRLRGQIDRVLPQRAAKRANLVMAQ